MPRCIARWGRGEWARRCMPGFRKRSVSADDARRSMVAIGAVAILQEAQKGLPKPWRAVVDRTSGDIYFCE